MAPENAQKPFSVAHCVQPPDVDDPEEPDEPEEPEDPDEPVEPDEPDEPEDDPDEVAPYQQLFEYPNAGSVCDTLPLTQLTPFVNGPLMSYINDGEVVPNTTFAVPVNEQNCPSVAQSV
ncbi:hypothetical protein [Trinickia mobilis]|uniref:hypothetical protein n=1 Tax=Trinickia mobilis TaxID=2816356 RepID=UPI001A8CFD99|nr:hypothetical protein [Trinickia mobilis]